MSDLMKKMYNLIEEKNIRNKQLLDKLFDIAAGFDTQCGDDSAFEDDPIKLARRDSFIKKYIEPISSYREQEDMWFDYVESTIESQQLGFRVGFQTALKLILESEGRMLPFIRLGREANE